MENMPRVGVGVIVIRNGRILLGKRRGSHGAGCWAFPGGHLEYRESVSACAEREVREETGLSIHNMRHGPYTDDHFRAEGKHYITVFVLADCAQGEAQVLEPLKCEEWAWHDWSRLPRPLFLPVLNLLKQGYVPPGCNDGASVNAPPE